MLPPRHSLLLILIVCVVSSVLLVYSTRHASFRMFHSETSSSGQENNFESSSQQSVSPEYVEGDAKVGQLKSLVDSLPGARTSKSQTLSHGFELLQSADIITSNTSRAAAELRFFSYIRHMQINCPQSVRIGIAGDDGWNACIAGPFKIRAPCLVYSVGMGPVTQWSFDNAITSQYNCMDMAFDPTVGYKDHKKGNIWFHDIGLSGKDYDDATGKRFRTLKTLLKDLNHTQSTIDILKIDIEYAEWEAIETMLFDGTLLEVKQLMIEYHTSELFNGRSTTSKEYAYFWQLMRGLDRLGFKRWYQWINPTGHFKSKFTNLMVPCCGNIYFVNINYLL